jgi:hypothetical protein
MHGAASYSRAINVAPGVNGMSPSLSLAYAESGVNGPVGYGWKMQGLSLIARCSAVMATDRVITAVVYGPNDKLCLDGQRLIQVDPTTGAVINGTFPAAGSTTPFQQGDAAGQANGSFIEYRTEKDSYARIRSYGYANGAADAGPAYFRVWSKSGQISSYGADPSASTTSALILQTSQGAGNAVAVAWAVARISDTLGNAIDFKYQQSDTPWGSGDASPASPALGHEWYLSEVDYGVNKVVFSYAPRTNAAAAPKDDSEAYHLGFKNVITQLLQAVTSYAGSTPVSTTNIKYSVGAVSGRSRISSLQDCAGDASSTRCLPATSFDYADGGGDVYQANAGFTTSGLATTPLTNANGTYGVLVGDFDGDGRTDILRWSDDPSQNQLWLSRTIGGIDTFVQVPSGSSGSNVFNLAGTKLFSHDGCHISIAMDFNGDGRTDILNIAPSTDSCVGDVNIVYLSQGDGSFKSVAVPQEINLSAIPRVYTTTPAGTTWEEGDNFYLLDVNGDGYLDIVTTVLPASLVGIQTQPADPCVSRICTRVFLGVGDGTFQQFTDTNLTHHSVYSTPAIAPDSLSSPANTGDWNGDGLTDLYTYLGVWLSNGDGNFTPVSANSTTGCATPIDFNGDGRTDCLNVFSTSASLALGGSNGSVGNFNLASQSFAGKNALLQTDHGIRILDVNGDGREDILMWSDTAANNSLWLSNGDGTFTKSTTFKLDGINSVQLQSADGTASFVAGDFTGRGTVEILRMQTIGNTVTNRLYTKIDAAPPDQLKRVTSGTGAKTSLYYAPLTNSAALAGPGQALGARYASDRNDVNLRATYPVVDQSLPLYVVVTSVEDSGVGSNTVQTEYAYKGLKDEIGGHGSLGFREILRQQPGADGSLLTQDTQLMQIYPYTGEVASTKTYLGALNASPTTPLSSQTNTYCDITAMAASSTATPAAPCPVTAKVQRPVVLAGVQIGFDLAGNPMPTVVGQNTYDAAGNIKIATTTTAGSVAGVSQTFIKTVTNTYQDDITDCADYQTCHWLLGRITLATVTSAVPDNFASITTSAGSASNASAIAGNGPVQMAKLAPTLDFGIVNVGASLQKTITLTNDGIAAWSMTAPSAASLGGTDFSFVATTCTNSLPAGSNCTITVAFTPSAQATRLGTLVLSTGVGTLSTSLSGQSLQAKLTSNPVSVAFGTQQVSGSYTSSQITLSNTGGIAASGVGLSLPQGFALSADNCSGATLAVNANCTFYVTWSPTAIQAYGGSITISAPNAVPSTIAVSGTAAALTGSVSAVDFGGVQLGSSGSANAVLTNTGGLPLAITVPTAANVSGAGFGFTSTDCQPTLSVGTSCNVRLTFNASVYGTNSGVLTISTNAGLLSSNLTSSGLQARLAFNPSTYDWGSQLVNGTYSTSMTLSNNGNTVASALNIPPPPPGFALSNNTCNSSLNSGASCSMTVSWTPTVVQPYSGSLTASTSTGVASNSLSLSGNAVQASLSFSTTSQAWGNVQVSSSQTQSPVTLTNNGNATATAILLSLPAPFSIQGGNSTCGSTLAAGASCSFSVTFSPVAIGYVSGTLTATTSAGVVTNSLSMNGTGVKPVANLTPPLAMGNVPLGSSATGAMTLSNDGVTTVTFTTPNSSSVTGQGFSLLSTDCTGSLPTDHSCQINVQFAPTVAGLVNGNVKVDSNAGVLSNTLSGTGAQPQLSFSTTTINWGNQAVGGPYTSSQITLSNTGNATANAVALSIAGAGFSVTNNTCGSSLANGNSCTFTVSWQASAAQSYSGTVSVSSSNSSAPTPINVSGTGIQASLNFSPNSLNFGSQQVNGAYTSSTVTLSNGGNTPALGLSLTASGGFTLSNNNCGTTLANPGSCTFTVSWNPTQVQSYGGVVTASTSNAAPANSVVLSGSVYSGNTTLMASPSSVDLGTVAGGLASASKTITVQNTGLAAATLTFPFTYTSGTTSNGQFYIDGSSTCVSGSSLAGGGSCSIKVAYTANCTTGSRHANMNIQGNNFSTVTVALTAVSSKGCN